MIQEAVDEKIEGESETIVQWRCKLYKESTQFGKKIIFIEELNNKESNDMAYRAWQICKHDVQEATHSRSEARRRI